MFGVRELLLFKLLLNPGRSITLNNERHCHLPFFKVAITFDCHLIFSMFLPLLPKPKPDTWHLIPNTYSYLKATVGSTRAALLAGR